MFGTIQRQIAILIDPYFTWLKEFENRWESFEKKRIYLITSERDKYLTYFSSYPFHGMYLKVLKLTSSKENKKLLDEVKRSFDRMKNKIEMYNEKFVHQMLQEYATFFDGTDDNLDYTLDGEQRKAIIIDDQHNLLVAAAGSGKTSVLTTRIAYLVRRFDAIKEERILALAFNTDAVEEMKKRLKENFNIDNVKVQTFHSFGLNVLHSHSKKIYEIVKPEAEIKKIFTKLFSADSQFQEMLIEYIKNYLQEEPQETGFKTQDEFYYYMQNQRYITLSGIEVRSIGEREIANFLFIHGIEFDYEPRALWADKYSVKHVSYHPDFFLPKYDIYIEHWGLNRAGNVASWFSLSSKQYQEDRVWKLEVFKKANKVLVESWMYEQKEGVLLENLKAGLLLANPSITFNPLSYKEIIQKIDETLKDQKSRIHDLVKTFITYSKSNSLKSLDIEKRLHNGRFDKKTALFSELALLVYKHYEREMEVNNKIDFDDMINKAIEIIRTQPEKFTNMFDQILVDEFQDISNQRMKLIQCFVNKNTSTKLFCVGDDWQSINQFAGSEVDLFIHFEKYFQNPTITYLTTNYRSTKTIVDMSTQLISFNKSKRDKKVLSKMPTEMKAYVYKITQYTNNYEYAKSQNLYILGQISQILKAGFFPEEIMVLSRFNKPLFQLHDLIKEHHDEKIFEKIQFSTVHKSKGKQAKHVFIINIVSGVRGFPSEIEDDKVLEIVKERKTKENKFEEERRLFYVALTRSKEYLYLYTHEGSESLFLNEVKEYLHEPQILKKIAT